MGSVRRKLSKRPTTGGARNFEVGGRPCIPYKKEMFLPGLPGQYEAGQGLPGQTGQRLTVVFLAIGFNKVSPFRVKKEEVMLILPNCLYEYTPMPAYYALTTNIPPTHRTKSKFLNGRPFRIWFPE